jgi:hypothetical protein
LFAIESLEESLVIYRRENITTYPTGQIHYWNWEGCRPLRTDTATIVRSYVVRVPADLHFLVRILTYVRDEARGVWRRLPRSRRRSDPPAAGFPIIRACIVRSCCRTHPAVAEATSIVSFRRLPPALSLSLYICCQIHTHPACTICSIDR